MKTKDFADVIRAKLANDPDLAEAVGRERIEVRHEIRRYRRNQRLARLAWLAAVLGMAAVMAWAAWVSP